MIILTRLQEELRALMTRLPRLARVMEDAERDWYPRPGQHDGQGWTPTTLVDARHAYYEALRRSNAIRRKIVRARQFYENLAA